MATVLIPTPLRRYTNNVAKADVKATNILEVIKELSVQFPDAQGYLYDPKGNIPSFINIYVDDTDIRFLDKEKTKIKEKSVINIIPAIAGG